MSQEPLACGACGLGIVVDMMFRTCLACTERFLIAGADSVVRSVNDRVRQIGWSTEVLVRRSDWLPVLRAMVRREPTAEEMSQIAFAVRCTRFAPEGDGELVSMTLFEWNALLATSGMRKRSRLPVEPRVSTRPRTPISYQRLNEHDILGAIMGPAR